MIEVFDAKRTRSYGCFASFKAATDTLDSLAATGPVSYTHLTLPTNSLV